jgi:cytochrome c peroxidase
MPGHRSVISTFLTVFLVLLLAGATVSANSRNLQTSAHQTVSQKGLFKISLTSITNAAPFNKLHHWHIQLTTRRGRVISNATIDVTGKTLDHDHNLPTSPKVSKEIERGHYLLEGVKFDRQGAWQLKLNINTPAGRDVAVFKIPVDTAIWADWHDGWSADERQILKSLWLGSLPEAAPDPSNAVAANSAAADFGHRLFFDTRLSQNGEVACATCHIPELAFTDGRKMAQGIGQTRRNAPTIIGAAYSPWLFWDGRKDSLWSQALGPFENPVEHGTSRAKIIAVVSRDQDYRRRYQALFGALPKPGDRAGITRAFTNLGKSIAAYERNIMPAPAKFDRYVEAILSNKKPAPKDQLSIEEIAGLKVFISDNQGQCIRCHNGPMFTDNHFHNIGSHIVGEDAAEQGRATGIHLALSDKTNCRSEFNDDVKLDQKAACTELQFARQNSTELVGAFKTPTLRYLAQTAPYMHAGQFGTLEDAIWQYRDVPHATVGESELRDLTISDAQFRQIEDFLATLNGPIRAPAKYLKPPE